MTPKSLPSLIRAFLKDTRGNYALMTIIAAVPLFGAVALAVDYSEMSRERQMTFNALDAAGIATARRILEGATDTEVQTYARKFFNANLGNIDPDRATLKVDLPESQAGGGLLKMSANLSYDPVFFGTFQSLMGKQSSALSFAAATQIKLKNTIEVALVLDNSGSMDDLGKGSGRKRIDVLKDAAKQLVDTLALESGKMKQVDEPVQIGLVPFAASVNVGPTNDSASWMDTEGTSPIHHENFDWNSFGDRRTSPKKYVEQVGDVRWARGSDWGDLQDRILTRFTLYKSMQRVVSQNRRTGAMTYDKAADWEGCVEARPYPYNINDTPASKGTPATLFVPMFAPDETDQEDTSYRPARPANNDWWSDGTTNSSALVRQRYMPKYFTAAPLGTAKWELNQGPNASCSTKPITPLVDVSKTDGVNTIKAAIGAMEPLGATNVPEGMAWGWRILSSAAPFTDGRLETEKGNDKVLIVLTDGANTYYTPESVSVNDYSKRGYSGYASDLAANKSIYSAYGFTRQYNAKDSRIFQGTSSAVRKTDFSNGNYATAMNQHFQALCEHAKEANLVVMTVALDLDDGVRGNTAQIQALTTCASDSRFRKDKNGKAEKLFWNSTGKSLAEDFKSIADELSNLRIVS